MTPKQLPWARIAAVAALVIIADIGTKIWAEHALADGKSVTLVPWVLSLDMVHNFDGWLSTPRGPWALEVAVFVVAHGFAAWTYRQHHRRDDIATSHAAAVAGGTIHAVERLVRDGVVDFIGVNIGAGWVTFNVADAAITLGLVGMAWLGGWSKTRRDEGGE